MREDYLLGINVASTFTDLVGIFGYFPHKHAILLPREFITVGNLVYPRPLG